MHIVIGASSVNLVTGWNTVWSAVQSALGPLATLLTAVGSVMVVGGVLKWIWDRRRGGGGGGQGHAALLWTILFGAILASPGLLIPFFLTVADFVINAIVNLTSKSSGG
jgi:hypothetical protein